MIKVKSLMAVGLAFLALTFVGMSAARIAHAAIFGLSVTNTKGNNGFTGSGAIDLPTLDGLLENNSDITSSGVEFDFAAFIPDEQTPIDKAIYTKSNLEYLSWDFNNSDPTRWD